MGTSHNKTKSKYRDQGWYHSCSYAGPVHAWWRSRAHGHAQTRFCFYAHVLISGAHIAWLWSHGNHTVSFTRRQSPTAPPPARCAGRAARCRSTCRGSSPRRRRRSGSAAFHSIILAPQQRGSTHNAKYTDNAKPHACLRPRFWFLVAAFSRLRRAARSRRSRFTAASWFSCGEREVTSCVGHTIGQGQDEENMAAPRSIPGKRQRNPEPSSAT
jgi:hypothetical protein